jgi:hypothetical protein
MGVGWRLGYNGDSLTEYVIQRNILLGHCDLGNE